MKKIFHMLTFMLLLHMYTMNAQEYCKPVNWQRYIKTPKTNKEKIESIYIHWKGKSEILSNLNDSSFTYGNKLLVSLEKDDNTEAISTINTLQSYILSCATVENDFKCVAEIVPLLKTVNKYCCTSIETLNYVESVVKLYKNPGAHHAEIVSLIRKRNAVNDNANDYDMVVKELNRLDTKYALSAMKTAK